MEGATVVVVPAAIEEYADAVLGGSMPTVAVVPAAVEVGAVAV